MLPFSKQIQLVTDFAAKGCARLTHSEVPSTPDTEKTFEELRQRLAKAADYVRTFKPAQFEGADTKDVTFPAGPDHTMTLKGQAIPHTSPSRISISTPPPPTTSCATTASKSASAISSA